MLNVLSLMKKYSIPPPLKKEVLTNEELLREAADFLDRPAVLTGFPGLIFHYTKGKAYDTEKRRVDAIANEYGVEAFLWSPPKPPKDTHYFLELEYDIAREVIGYALSFSPKRVVIVARESVLISLMAEPGWREYGPLSVLASLGYHIKDAFRLENTDVFPKRAGVGMMFLEKERDIEDGEKFFAFLKRIFIQRNKKLFEDRPERLPPEKLYEYFRTTFGG